MIILFRGNRGKVSTYLELSVNDPILHNLVGCTLEQYKHRLKEIRAFLMQNYGIFIDYKMASFKYMEIQKTIELDKACNEYSRVAALLINDIPKARRLKKPNVHYGEIADTNVRYVQSLSRSSGLRGLEVGFYDKGAQLDEKNYPREKASPSEIFRLELKLKSKTFIKRALGSCLVWQLHDSDICNYYNKFINENFAESYALNTVHRIKKLVEMANKVQSENYHWVRNLLLMAADYELEHKVPLMLDVKEMIQALDIIGYADSKQKYYVRKSVMNTCQKYIPFFISNDDIKCQRLIHWFISTGK